MERVFNSLKSLFPDNKVSFVKREKNYLDISVSSNHLKKIIPWESGGGSKFVQKARVPLWIKKNRAYKINCLRGLIETDGSIYDDRGYKMITFTTIIPDLADDFYDMIISLGFNPHSYKILGKKHIEYHIRLSKNVADFLYIVKANKN